MHTHTHTHTDLEGFEINPLESKSLNFWGGFLPFGDEAATAAGLEEKENALRFTFPALHCPGPHLEGHLYFPKS